VMVWSRINGHSNAVSPGDYLEWKRQNSVFQDLVAWGGTTFSLSVSDHPESVQARITSPGFFGMQGTPFSLGRDFVPEEGILGREHVVIINNKLWQQRFGSDPKIIGKALRLNTEPYTVVGVLAAGMPDRFESPLFIPLAFRPDQINHNAHYLVLMGRLKPEGRASSAA
jgi:putative ABC transport system permease protein